MAEKPYRFLLRMPEDLRQRLVASADGNSRSLNSEVVHRLERSLEVEARTALHARIAALLAAPASWSRGVPRVGVALAASAAVMTLAALSVETFGSSGTASRSYDLAPPYGAVVGVPFPAVKRYTPVAARSSRAAG